MSSLTDSSSDDLFRFHPHVTNPELWRTTVPLVVRKRCEHHKGLIATWTAIHWLIVLHAASGRCDFGVRDIAAEAGVGRNELTGPTGHIQRLIELGLLRIVDYCEVKGFRERRPVYHIDLIELERMSLVLVPAVLRDHHVHRPPPAAPDPRQMSLFALSPTDAAPSPTDSALSTDHARESVPMHANGTALINPSMRDSERLVPVQGPVMHENGTDRLNYVPVMHEIGAGVLSTVPVMHGNETSTHENRTALHEIGTDVFPVGPDLARDRDVERERERRNQRERDTLTPELIQTIVTQATQAVLATLTVQNPHSASRAEESPSVLTTMPPIPPDANPLPAPLLALWQGDRLSISRREQHQLAMLAVEYDAPTGGYGAYWLGRAILMADICLGDRDQPLSLAYVRTMLRRWQREGSWGSDREPVDAGIAGPPERLASTQPADVAPRPISTGDHPAVRAYVAALHETPNAVQSAQIAETVSDLDIWQQVLTDWQLNGWGERSVGKMLDRYRKTLPAPVGTPGVSAMAIYTHPGLADEQRDRWIKRFHAAITPAEKRAVLEQLEQEHPR